MRMRCVVFPVFDYLHGDTKEGRRFHITHGYRKVKFHQLCLTVGILLEEDLHVGYIRQADPDAHVQIR